MIHDKLKSNLLIDMTKFYFMKYTECNKCQIVIVGGESRKKGSNSSLDLSSSGSVCVYGLRILDVKHFINSIWRVGSGGWGGGEGLWEPSWDSSLSSDFDFFVESSKVPRLTKIVIAVKLHQTRVLGREMGHFLFERT